MNGIIKTGIAYCLIIIGILLIFYNIIGVDLFHLNSVQFDTSGDGFKNYFSFAYQYKYGKGIHFDGLLYPFGDLALYADGQILLVWLFQFLRVFGLDISSSLIGIVNVVPIITFYIGTISLYHIYTHYGIHWVISVIFALICSALSPQLLRIQSHFALAYPLIPILWLYLIKYQDDLTYFKIAFVCGGIILTGFIHPYHVFILSTFVFLIFFSFVLAKKKFRFGLLLCAILPMLLFYSIIKLLDPYSDRPSNPFGLEHHNTIWGDLFPYYGWFRDCFEGIVIYRHYYSEGYAYVGCLLLLLPLYLVLRKFQRKEVTSILNVNIPIEYLIAGLLSLFLGAGLHVLFTGGLILDLISPLKQFRGLGRLSWIYYYVIFVFLSIWCFKLVQHNQSSVIKALVSFVVLFMWLYEVKQYHKTIQTNYLEFRTQNNFEDRYIINDLLAKKGLDHASFQAIYTLPSSTEGVEKIDIHDDWHTKMYAMEYAYQSGLAITACVMSRSSVSAVLAIQQLSNPYYHQKNPIFSQNTKPYLILIQNERSPDYQDVLQKASYINENEHISLYQINPSALLSGSRLQDEGYAKAIDLKSTDLYSQGVIFRDYEDQIKVEGLAGPGAYFIKEGRELLLESSINIPLEKEYLVSLWYKIESDKSGIPVFFLNLYDEKGVNLSSHNFRDLNSGRLMVHDDWVRLKIPITVTKNVTRMRLEVEGRNNKIDKVLICPSSTNVILETADLKFNYVNHNLILK